MNLTSFFAGVFATLIGAFIAHFLTKDRENQKRFDDAAEKFIFAFQDEFSRLKHSRESTVSILKPAVFKHQSAYYIFRRYVPVIKKQDFTLAWKSYIINAPSQYDNEKSENQNLEEKYRIEMHDAIKKLLSFAEIK